MDAIRETLTRHPGKAGFVGVLNTNRRTKGDDATWGEAVCPWGPFYRDVTHVGERIEELQNEDHRDIRFSLYDRNGRISERPEYAAGIADVGSACRMWKGTYVTTETEGRIRSTAWIEVIRIWRLNVF